MDFIEKPFEPERAIHLVDRATESGRLRRENDILRLQAGHEDQLQGMSIAIRRSRTRGPERRRI